MTNKKIHFSLILFLISIIGFAQNSDQLLRSTDSNKDISLFESTYSSNRKINLNDEAITDFKSNDRTKNNKNQTLGVGTTPSELSVSLSGGASFNVPISTPSGIRGINPNVSLAYNSQAPIGLVGWGWNVTGLSTISRVASTDFHDGQIDGVDFDNLDRFAIDGERLIVKSGVYGAPNSVYQTEKYTNIKVVAYGTSPYGASYGPSYFIVYYPDGSRSWYGNSGNSHGRMEWALYKNEDPQGNFIAYTYATDNELKAIDKIVFGARNGMTSPNEIKFYYRNRKRPEHAYINGVSFKRTKILDRVEVRGNSQLYRKYILTHDETSLGYERLISIQEFNSVNEGLSPINFVYDNSITNVNPTTYLETIYPAYDYQRDKVLAGEYNGDGKLDFMMYDGNTKTQIHIFKNLTEQSFNNVEVAQTYNVPYFDDVLTNNMLNSDNKLLSRQGMTFIKENINGNLADVDFKSYYNSPTGLSYQYTRTWSANTFPYANSPSSITRKKIPKEYVSGDFNGDGLTDVLAIGKSYTSRYCNEFPCRTDSGFEIDQQVGESDKDYRIRKKDSESDIAARIPDPNDPDDPFDPDDSDGNGDGGTCYSCGTYRVTNKTVNFIDLNRNVTSSIAPASFLEEELEEFDSVLAADFNGDGKSELFHFKEGKLFVYELDQDNRLVLIHTEEDSLIKLNRPIILGDYNGDGKIDFLTPTANNNSNWRFFISKGNGIIKYTKNIEQLAYTEGGSSINHNYIDGPNAFAYFDSRFLAQDINGDGKSDLIKQLVASNPAGHNYSDIVTRFYVNVYDEGDTSPSFDFASSSHLTNSGVGRFGVPIFLDVDQNNGNVEYAYISNNHLSAYEFNGNHNTDVTLKQISNNGLTYNLEYHPVDVEALDNENVYSGAYDQVYPYVNMNVSSNLKVIKNISETGSGFIRTQDYRYTSAVSHLKGLGFLGFKQIKKTNWNGDDVQRLWNITDYDPFKRGAAIQNWLSETPSSTPFSYLNKSTYTYQTQLTTNNVFINVPTQIVSSDNLLGVTKTKSFTYDSYYNTTSVTTTHNDGSEIANFIYENNATPNNALYHIGRLKESNVTASTGSETFNTQEKFYYNNNLVVENRKKSNNSPWLHTHYVYDAFGNAIQKKLSGTGIADRVENYAYDSSGRNMISSSDIEGMTTTYSYELATGHTLSTTNPYGLTTEYQYDKWGRVLKRTDYLGKEINYAYQNDSSYGAGGLLKITDVEEGEDVKVYSNAHGWVLEEQVLKLNNKWVGKKYEYDVLGKTLKESEPYFVTGAPSQWNQNSFDQYGRLISQQLYTGKIINTSYDGLSITIDDGAKTVTTTKDTSGNIKSVQDDGGTINYSYYGNGVMKSANYANYSINIGIDDWGRKITLNDPSAGNNTYSYNILGEVTQETTPKGVTDYSYDDYGRLTFKQIVGDNTSLSLQYLYNSTSKLLTTINGTDSINNRAYTYTYEYDNYFRPIRVKETTDSNIFISESTYDGFGRKATETYNTSNLSTGISSVVKIKNAYDAAGILKEIRDFDTNSLLWEINEENARGQALEMNLGNEITKRRNYDDYGFLTNITDNNIATGVQALKTDYTFNVQRGTLMNRKNYAFTNWEEAFTFDDLDRLTQVSGATTHSQDYDDRGRITNNSHVGAYNYDFNNAYRLTNVDLNNQGDIHYQQHSLQQVTYNAFKKPVAVLEEGKGRVSFEYGPLMNRTHSYYGGLNEVKTQRKYHKKYSSIIPVEVVEDNISGSTKIVTYVGGDAYTAPIAYVKQEGGGVPIDEYHYLHRDYLGSILAITDSSGDIKEQSQFGAWGAVDKHLSNSLSIQSTEFNHESLLGRGYTGHEHFFEVSLIHMNGRMYDANLGRFLSPDNYIQDPFGTQSFNRYGYVWNNPLSLTDASGEFVFTAIIVGAIIGGAVGAYFGGVAANGGEFAPWKWKLNVDTVVGVLGGAVIGGVSGGIGAYVGGAVAGVLATVGIPGGIISGVVSGATGGFVGGAIDGFFRAGLPGGSGDYIGGAIGGAKGGFLVGGVLGGVLGGVFTPKGHSIWTGAALRPTPTTVSEITPQPIQSADEALSIDAEGIKSIRPENNNVTKPVRINKVEQSIVRTKGIDGNTKYEIVDELIKVRHHTDPQSLKSIKASKLLYPSRGKPFGVDVEVAPFVNAKNANLGQAGKGAYVEFMVPRSQISPPATGYLGGNGTAGRIITNGAPLDISTSSFLKFFRWKWL